MALLRSLAAAFAALLPLTVPAAAFAATVGPGSFVIVARSGPTSPGPLSVDVVASATLDDLEDGRITATDPLSVAGSVAGGYMTENGVTFAAAVKAPNDWEAPVLHRGGFVKVFVERYFRKGSEEADLDYIFSGFVVSVAHDPDFGPRCPAGRFDCLQAGWRSVASAYKLDGTQTERQSLFAEVGSDSSATGYYFAEVTPFLALDTVVGINGASIAPTLSNNPAVPNVGLASLSLKDIGVNEVFRATFELTAWAYDGGSTIGPGRVAFSFVQDPLDPDLGITFALDGVEAVAAVPEPPTLWLMAAALLPLARLARRCRQA